jgi:hypothetical protein
MGRAKQELCNFVSFSLFLGDVLLLLFREGLWRVGVLARRKMREPNLNTLYEDIDAGISKGSF